MLRRLTTGKPYSLSFVREYLKLLIRFIVLEHDLFDITVDLAVGYTLDAALTHQPPFTVSYTRSRDPDYRLTGCAVEGDRAMNVSVKP